VHRLCLLGAVLVAAATVPCVHAEASTPATIRPPTVWQPIPFGPQRKLETAAYAQRHYGLATWRLRSPRVIVEHYTASDTLGSALATFAADVPDQELHELPGICAHYVIDTDGTIYQLVPLSVMCRHTVGLNWTAIGIEHVGTSAAGILANRRQLNASLALTAWLMRKLEIGIGDVIGHNESRTSRFHRERYRAWRCQTHADWTPAEMREYRGRLRVLARANDIPLGPAVPRKTPRC
jgi:N-acetylmuramoyl-L-alanine amidase